MTEDRSMMVIHEKLLDENNKRDDDVSMCRKTIEDDNVDELV